MLDGLDGGIVDVVHVIGEMTDGVRILDGAMHFTCDVLDHASRM